MRKLGALKVRGAEENKREEKTRFITWKSFISCSSIITPLPLLFKDEVFGHRTGYPSQIWLCPLVDNCPPTHPPTYLPTIQ
jgi:hypothetical protein